MIVALPLFSSPSRPSAIQGGAEGKEGSRPQVHTKPQATVDLIHTTDVADNSRTLFHPLADTHIRAKREMREGRNTNEPQNLPFHPPRVMHMGGLCSADGVNRKGFWKPTTKQGPCAPPPPTRTKPISALESTDRAISSGQRSGENVPNPERTVETRGG